MIRNSHRKRNRTDQVILKVLEEEIDPSTTCAAMIPSSKAMVASMEKWHFWTKGWQASTRVPTSDQPHRWAYVQSSFETSSSSKRYVARHWEILQTKSPHFIGSLSAAIFWTCLVLLAEAYDGLLPLTMREVGILWGIVDIHQETGLVCDVQVESGTECLHEVLSKGILYQLLVLLLLFQWGDIVAQLDWMSSEKTVQ